MVKSELGSAPIQHLHYGHEWILITMHQTVASITVSLVQLAKANLGNYWLYMISFTV